MCSITPNNYLADKIYYSTKLWMRRAFGLIGYKNKLQIENFLLYFVGINLIFTPWKVSAFAL